MNVVRTRRAKPRVSWKALALSLLAAGGAVAGGRRIGNMPVVRNAVYARQLRSINQQKRALMNKYEQRVAMNRYAQLNAARLNAARLKARRG